jgi:hypothetical protein
VNRVPDWVAEFGEDWQVPDVIALAEGIEDMSWHNDVCPSFGLHVAENGEPYAHTIRIWCDHPDPAQSGWGWRESPRFTVTYQADVERSPGQPPGDEIVGAPCVGLDGSEWMTDDPDEALRVFLRSLQYVRVAVRDRQQQP